MQDACVCEIVELHAFFQGWLDGSLPNSDEVFARFAAATAPDFTLIGPDGSMAHFAATAAWIRAAHGTRPGFQLWTTDHQLQHQDGNCAVVTYREWQTLSGATNVRVSTAVFQSDPAAPNGVVCLHVHETWLEKAA